MPTDHTYSTSVSWTGNRGSGTASYRGYGRDHDVSVEGKPVLPGSADPVFRGDRDRWNPEELLVAALSQCHMLAYLHLCAVNGVVVQAYTDDATGTMRTSGEAGEFVGVTLRPRVTVAEDAMVSRAVELHDDAHHVCFIARSVNFPVSHEPHVTAAVG